MRTLSKLLITRYEGRVLTARIQNGKVIQMDLEPSEASGRLGNIYIGKVKNIVKNINAAFVDLGGGQMGYYSLSDNESHLFTQPGRTGALREGDEILVQVSRDAVKTKAPVLTSNLNFPGRYSVLTVGKTAAGVSAKIKDAGERQRLKEIAGPWSGDSCGAILRTNAAGVPEEVLEEELSLLKKRMEQTLKEGTMRTCYSCLCREMPSYINGVRDARPEELEEILTDDGDIFEELTRYLEESRPEELPKLVLYDDPLLPLQKLYSLETAISHALARKVWLKSGAYLVIEPTEALAVIDVNSGKYAGRKKIDDTILKINLEAAEEIGRQLRLRNLSGIIIIDFIDMERAKDRECLMDSLRKIVSADPVKTTVVEMTKLNLVELTRKKVRRPFYEQMNEAKGDFVK